MRELGISGRLSSPLTIFSIDFKSEAILAAWECPWEATERRTTSSKRDDAFGLTAENAEDPLSWESPNNEEEREDTDDNADEERDEDNDDDREDDKDDDKAADNEEVDDVGRYGVNRGGLSRSGKIGRGAEGEVVVAGGAALSELELIRSVAVQLGVLELGKVVLVPARPAKPRYA